MMLQLHWPQIIWLAISVLGIGAHIAKHGEPMGAMYNGWSRLIHFIIYAALLWWGGFFGQAHAQVPADAARYRLELTRAAHSQWGLSAPVAVLAAQVHQESGWRQQAISRVGAKGLAQFMPGTARWWCKRTGLDAENCLPHNPAWALRALVGYDKYLYDMVPAAHYSEYDRMWVALRGYNGGLGHWRDEARVAWARAGEQQIEPTREQVDAACGSAQRSPVHCPENLGYPRRILIDLQPRYAPWGPGL